MSQAQLNKLDSVQRKAEHLGILEDFKTMKTILQERDACFFEKISTQSEHVLKKLIPERSCFAQTTLRKRLPPTSTSGSGCWIEFRIASAIRISAPVSAHYKCKCGTTGNTDGYPALICPKVKLRLTRYKQCNVLIQNFLKTVRFTNIFGRNERRPDGLTLTPWSRGKT